MMTIWVINIILVFVTSYGLTTRYRNVAKKARKSRDNLRIKYREETKSLREQNAGLVKELLETKKELYNQ